MKNFYCGSFIAFILVCMPLSLFYSCDAKNHGNRKDNIAGQHRDSSSENTADHHKDSMENPKQGQLTMPILKEGMIDSIKVGLYRSPAGSPISFELYYPSELILREFEQNGFTVELRRNEAILKLHLFNDEVDSQKEALLTARKQLAGLGELNEIKNGWSLTPNPKVIASVEVKKVDGKYIYWLKKYPVEYADGFGAEIHFIKENIRWH